MCTNPPSTHREGGSIAIATAISMVVMVGLLGVVVDLGRMYVIKTELQNAADACALAAAKELGLGGDFTRAENAGITVAGRHKVNFQSEAVSVTAADIKFSLFLSSPAGDNSNFYVKPGPWPPNEKYVMCTATLRSVPMTLSSIIRRGSHTIAAQAVATTQPSQTSCAIPLALCQRSGTELSVDKLYDGRFDSGLGGPGGATQIFKWVDFPDAPPVATLLARSGICNIAPGRLVSQAVVGQPAVSAWNSRFGLYGDGLAPLTSPPDFTGAHHTEWDTMGVPDLLSGFHGDRGRHAPYDGTMAGYSASTSEVHATEGANRRLVIAPIVDCALWAGVRNFPINDYGCVLMLDGVSGPTDTARMRYLGVANDPRSPCSTSGLPGGSFGPLVSVLVQ